MDGSIVLGSSERKRLLEIYRGKEEHPASVRLRAHIVLLLSDGHPWSLIEQILFCSTATIARWKDRFDSGGVEALLEENRGREATLLVHWALIVVSWVKTCCPRDFGYCRSR
jgi:putative transposase